MPNVCVCSTAHSLCGSTCKCGEVVVGFSAGAAQPYEWMAYSTWNLSASYGAPVWNATATVLLT